MPPTFPLVVAAILSAPVVLATQDLRIERTAPDQYELAWPTNSGWQYWLEESDNLTGWDPVDDYPRVASGRDLKEPVAFETTPEFFRLTTDPNRLWNIAVPEDGLRYDSYAEFDGPRWPDVYGEGHVTLWHKGKLAAYSITIDDNNSPDFPFWLQVSEDYGWNLTWFVIVYPYVWDIYNDKPGTNTGYFGTLAEWKTLHDLGFDIQLHGACASMNDQTEAEYEDQIVRSIEVMEEQTGTKILTFAYPCGATSNGAHSYIEIIRRYMIGARGTAGGVTPVHLLDYHNTKSLGGNGLTNGEPSTLFSRYNEKRSFLYSQYRGWCVTLYHGVGSGQAGILATLDWVKAHEDEFWVDTFTNVAKYAQQRESATLDITSVGPNVIEFNVTDRMEDAIFDHPLTVKLRVDNTWADVTATQNGAPITAYLVTHAGNQYAYIEPIPDRGDVVVTRVP